LLVLITATLGASLLPATAVTNPDRAAELARLAQASLPTEQPWSFTMTPSWSETRRFAVVGAEIKKTEHVRTTVAGKSSWMIGGKTFASVQRDNDSAHALAEVNRLRARWIELDRDRDRYVLTESPYSIDSSARPDRVAAWLAENGPVSSSTSGKRTTYRAVRAADTKLPSGVSAVFYPDRKNQIAVVIKVSSGKVTGYVFKNNSDIGMRSVHVSVREQTTRLNPPAAHQLVKLSLLEDALEEINAPRRVLPALITGAGADLDQEGLRILLHTSAKGMRFVVARTSSGFAIFPQYYGNTEKQLNEARCLFRDDTWKVRSCEKDDGAVLDMIFEPYADFVHSVVARLPMSAEQLFWALDRLNHNLWLYSGLQFTLDQSDDWSWFMLDTLSRAQLASACSKCVPTSVI
jgi:hypothetical protein